MTAKNLLTSAPPYEVEQAIKRLGKDLRTARLRRNLTIDQVAGKIGTGPRAVMDAEKGKLSTGIATYAALLWAYDLLGPMNELADPAKDREGLTLESLSGRERARTSRELDNDF
ncbi:transcriptional regulator [Novosphingobium endophyticum]|uniref:Transcriptional regulator n=1 Tax=Novosphingobium endophyticum TaxID=1955250 RepID=A0A916X6E1_9SPHN|nr:helix-turn-helix domain-containing protein [Novosphingobium endophyticum]GGC16888.1 transcriptional regulator [Novosphingobium endophyticum]